eukprot:XP_011420040.1 PREDICTED: inhibin beta A chain [Crassostrea gigas]
MCIPVFLKISEPTLWIILLVLPLQFYSTAEIPWPGVKQPGDFRYLPSGLRRINLKPIMRLDQLRRKICELIRMGCDEQSTDPKKNETTSEIIFTPMKPPDFDKKDVKIVNLPPVFSRPADSTNDPHCMQFRIPDEYFEEGVDIQGADIYIYFKVKTRRKGSRRIVLKVFSLQNGSKRRKNVAKLQIRPNDTAWYKVSLPRSITNSFESYQNRTVSMCIDCRRCNKRTRITFPLKTHPSKRKRKRSRKNKRKNRKNRRQRNTKKKRGKKPKELHYHRPFLIYRLKQNHRSKRNLDNNPCSLSNDTQSCCKYEQFVSFSDMGFEQNILFPSGVTYSSCIGGCGGLSLNQNIPEMPRVSSENSVCHVTESEETSTFLVLRDRIGILTLKNGNVLQCGCSL